eukprot:TRINITY_DN11212_c0_g1_i1.p1 TRINITY_DN11212_c0_g1~~TRINITY_DN11212_c0_g1_i1.p1  ORF type:complete len:475 (+),score=60.33 TRINITY_DN11212_c0_g1_i1:105-1529(+)
MPRMVASRLRVAAVLVVAVLSERHDYWSIQEKAASWSSLQVDIGESDAGKLSGERLDSVKHIHTQGNQTDHSIHWIFTTDCSAYMLNQGNLLLGSALYVNQPGNFTWIMVGCTTEEQKAESAKLLHPEARVWHTPDVPLKHPRTGDIYPSFQASNRPGAIAAWYKETKPTEELIVTIDPDEYFLRAVYFKDQPRNGSYGGPLEMAAAQPGIARAAYYAIGCVALDRMNEDVVREICGSRIDVCLQGIRDRNNCVASYASGPPWVLHRSDADNVFGEFSRTAILVNEVWKFVFAEQSAYGISQMMFGYKSIQDVSWFLSVPYDTDQDPIWRTLVASSDFDPCFERKPPSPDENLPVFWHACVPIEIPTTAAAGFKIFKDYILKDLLDCDAPLVRYPPEDVLKSFVDKTSIEYRATWSVCLYTNIINTYATGYKQRFCTSPNLNASYQYSDAPEGFINPNSRIKGIFPQGGWADPK